MDGPQETALLVGVEFKGKPTLWSLEDSLSELAQLADTAGLRVTGTIEQRIEHPNPATLIGSGKVAEMVALRADLGANVVIFDEELSPAQQRELEQAIGNENVMVLDRTALILDIFARHAHTREGALQVELAQYEYRLPRLTRAWTHLARQAGGGAARGGSGGVGLRGPGETQLEVDRREIRKRIARLKAELEDVRLRRARSRSHRVEDALPVVGLVGYTNAGKSTLLNKISGADVYVKDQLFATLDAVSRNVNLGGGSEFLLVDTVGFIRKLPHDLVEAFHSTLEEATLADILLIVSDAASPDCLKQHQVVLDVLNQLGASGQPRIDVLNKCDAAANIPFLPGAVHVSATEGTGLDELLNRIASLLNAKRQQAVLLVPFSQYGAVSEVRSLGQIVSEEHLEEGTRITALLEDSAKNRLISKYGNQIFVKK